MTIYVKTPITPLALPLILSSTLFFLVANILFVWRLLQLRLEVVYFILFFFKLSGCIVIVGEKKQLNMLKNSQAGVLESVKKNAIFCKRHYIRFL